MIRNLFCLPIIVSLSALPVLAQQEETLATKVYEVKYKRAEDIAKLLVGYDSGESRQAQIQLVPGSINQAFNTFTVRAWPKGHVVVADILQKYDVPNKTIEFQFYLIKANTAGEELKDKLPEKVQKALKEVASLTRYKSFELIDAPYIRTKEGSMASLAGEGIYNYKIFLPPPKLEPQANLVESQISLTFFIPVVSPDGKSSTKSIAELATSFSIKEGEVVALGASQIEKEGKASGAAIITIVTVKITPQ